MSKKKQFSDQQIDDLFSKVDISLEKNKDLIWAEKFAPLVKDDIAIPNQKTSVFRLSLHYGIAASFVLLLASTFYFNSQNAFQKEAKLLEVAKDSELDLLADQTMIESLFVQDNEFDEWFEEQYVLSSVN